jgi:Clostripain family
VEIATHLKNWALYVFFGANVPEAEVREAAIQNLLQMATVGSSHEVAVAAQLHLPGKWAYRYVMPERPPGSDPGVIAPVETIPNANSADPHTIITFFKWALKECPATNTMLVIWGHGYGIDDYLPRGARPNTSNGKQIAQHQYRAEGPPDEDKCRTLEDGAKLTETALIEQIPATRYIDTSLMEVILDECALEVLPNARLAKAAYECDQALKEHKRELTILGLDACAMALAEVWCEIHNYAKIGIASEAQEPDASFPYDRFLARLILQPKAESRHVAQMMVDAYVESYAYECETFVTLSACNLTRTEGLEKAVHQLAKALINVAADPLLREIIFRARNDSPIFDPDGFIDLGRFCEILEHTLPDPAVCKACNGVRHELKHFVEYARYSPLDPTLRISQTTGLSVWFPPWLEDPFICIPEREASIAYLINGYDCTKFAQNTCWGVFLRSMWYTGRNCPDLPSSASVGP